MSADGITDEQYFAAMHDMERRAVAEARACESIPTEALEAGVVEKMVDLTKEVEERCTLIKQMNGSYGHWSEVADTARTLLRQLKGDHHG